MNFLQGILTNVKYSKVVSKYLSDNLGGNILISVARHECAIQTDKVEAHRRIPSGPQKKELVWWLLTTQNFKSKCPLWPEDIKVKSPCLYGGNHSSWAAVVKKRNLGENIAPMLASSTVFCETTQAVEWKGDDAHTQCLKNHIDSWRNSS